MRSNLSVINILDRKISRSKVVTQLLYGESFKIINTKGKWIKIKNKVDNYKGYIKLNNFKTEQKSTHKIHNLYAHLYSKPNFNNKVKKKLSFNSKIKILEKKGNYYKFDNLWINKKDLKKINHKDKDVFKNILKFINTKYKWGGKHYSGIDCSGLVQLCLNYNNRFCPRDTQDQIKFFKKKIKLKNIKKNDLIFWKGHVAICLSKKKLIHAYGPAKKVVIMSIKKTIDKIFKTANLKMIGVRRVV